MVWIQGVNWVRGIESAIPQEVVGIPVEPIRAGRRGCSYLPTSRGAGLRRRQDWVHAYLLDGIERNRRAHVI